MSEVATSVLGTSGDVRLVQFPHPGGEHNMPASGRRPWKLGREDHARTFLLSPGSYRSALQAEDQQGEVAFWGEWEGAVDLVTEVERVPGGPRWLCRPDPHGAAPLSDEGTPPQNTDPFVWGDAIRYTFCRQPGNGKLRRMGRGSVILFGSSLDHRFVLDAVLVVAGWIEHRRRDDLVGHADETYMRATIEPMYGWGEDGQTYRLYIGATPDAPVDGMFSFVPCRPAAERNSGFARPVIGLNGLINPMPGCRRGCWMPASTRSRIYGDRLSRPCEPMAWHSRRVCSSSGRPKNVDPAIEPPARRRAAARS